MQSDDGRLKTFVSLLEWHADQPTGAASHLDGLPDWGMHSGADGLGATAAEAFLDPHPGDGLGGLNELVCDDEVTTFSLMSAAPGEPNAEGSSASTGSSGAGCVGQTCTTTSHDVLLTLLQVQQY